MPDYLDNAWQLASGMEGEVGKQRTLGHVQFKLLTAENNGLAAGSLFIFRGFHMMTSSN